MRISIILFGVVIAFLMVAGLVYAAYYLPTTSTPTDSYMTAPTEATNSSTVLLTDISNVGVSAGAGLVLLFSCLAVLAGIGLVRAYAR